MTQTSLAPIAIRMGCARAGAGLVAVSLCDDADAAADCRAEGGNAASIADAVALHISANGLPASVEAEGRVYRLTASTAAGRLAGNVVIVTGSGQGFGRGIAEGLAAEGAHVVIADINAETGEQTANEIRQSFGADSAIFAEINVADEASVEACLARTVEAFGGIDIFIANAGVLKAGGLDEMDEASFDFVTNVNYKGYFICAKVASAYMREQHSLHSAHAMDIIQINSKSGLEGSKRNFAYAGSKFGGIGLTQSFALELVAYNIKVNAVCPGNFFDGPLWSDPERGLFVQYLRAGKVEGAKTLDDVRAFYMSKVPMGRGCVPADVVRAILYLHEQEYETGQALPVSGGQTMLN